jgi:asparagine synthase (glutamine-hydrolysing)
MRSLYTADFGRAVSKERSVGAVMELLSTGGGASLVNRMLYVDTKTSLPDDLLLKADKMTMANSLELRVPFLDHVLLEFAASLPARYKVNGFRTKYLLRKALKGNLPRAILERKKVGFPVPYESWLRTELRPWIKDLLLDRDALSRGYFEKRCVETIIADDARHGGYSKELLSLATLELWHRVFAEQPKAVS